MEKERRSSVVIYENWHNYLKTLSPEQYIQGMEMIMEYALDGVIPDTKDPALFGFFCGICPVIDSNNKRYIASKKGGRPKKVKAAEGESNEDLQS